MKIHLTDESIENDTEMDAFADIADDDFLREQMTQRHFLPRLRKKQQMRYCQKLLELI